MIAWVVGGLQKLKLYLDDEQSLALWKVEVFPNITDSGHLYLHRGWSYFARILDLRDGYSLVLWYDGRSQINVKVFDITNNRKQYPHDFEASGNQLSLPIVEPRSFAVILKKYHLKVKYLNVLMDFERVHDYKQRRIVEL
ncbi:B3 domain-containing protein Os03g0212300-like [Miscanthus floridulus]|uniref:B3 domain-containing protein Os03g0212300-like n=1 Tax=Miscanthus floridulus TaxID=154761 RepID=UPI00345858DB